jgi:hypothetical protein
MEPEIFAERNSAREPVNSLCSPGLPRRGRSLLFHRLRNCGLRFSMKAAIPSFWSSSAKVE